MVIPSRPLRLVYLIFLLNGLTLAAFGQILQYEAPVPTVPAAGPITIGFMLRASERAIVIEQLGMFDNFGEIQEPHTVGLWKRGELNLNLPGGFRWSLMATSVFVPGDNAFQSGGYRYHTIPPVQFQQDTEFAIAVHYPYNSLDPVAQSDPDYLAYLPISRVYGRTQLSVDGASIQIPRDRFLAANLILSTNLPPVPRATLPPAPRPITGRVEPWLLTTNKSQLEVIMDATGSSDPENAPLTYQWIAGSQEPLEALGTGVIFTNSFAVTQVVYLRLRASDPLQYADAVAAFEAHSPETAIAQMKETVSYCGARRILKTTLRGQLRLAEASFRRNRFTRGLRRMEYFQQRTLQRLQGPDPGTFATLMDMSQAVIDVVPR